MHFEYNITLDTTNYVVGDYKSWLEAFIGNNVFESKDKPTFTINSAGGYSKGGGGSGVTIYNKSWANLSSCGDGVCDASIGETPENCPADCFEALSFKEGEEEEPPQGFFSGITGAVIGTLGTTGSILIIIFILGISTIAGIIIYRKRRTK